MAASHSTRHSHVSEHNASLAARLRGPWYFTNNLPSMCLSLLDQAERRRQSEGKADTILPARMRGARKSRGTAGIVEMCILVYGCARLGDRGGNNVVMPTRVMV